MHPATRARTAAAILALTAAALWYLGQSGPAVVLVGIAAAVAILVPDRSMTTDVAHALHTGPTQGLADMADAVRLQGRGILRAHKDTVMLFLPTHAAAPGDCPVFDGQTRLHQRPPVGMWVTPPGKGLFDAWRANDTLHRGVEGATATLKRALPGLGLGQDVHVEQGATLRVTFRPTLPADDATRPWHLMGGDAVTSFIGMVLAHAMGRPVQLLHRDDVEAGHQTEWQV